MSERETVYIVITRTKYHPITSGITHLAKIVFEL